ncbi:glycoside hydrolase family 51 protein [Thozetella sp. PMI_491]|nr:glycoside hydrolase family 51 protein [Thozetella sp. PMI_491]
MFEDINHSGDGGVYAELIQNRAFQAGTLEAWSAVGDASLALDTTSPLSSALPTSVQVTSNNGGLAGISNTGWWGIDVKEHHTYRGSFYSYGAYSGNFTASLVSDITQEVLGSVSITSRSSEGVWTQHTYELIPTTSAANSNNSFHLQYDAPAGAVLGFNLISLFPPTFNDRPNGNRIELMQALKDLNPKYFRIPGGNNLEGNSSPNYWNWSATLGPLTDRPGRAGTWGYHNTDGLGLVEYMDWCTDLGVEPVLALWGGLFLDGTIIPEDELSFYVDDALNELEFLMGDPSTTFGALRASLGRSVPWKIRFVEIGNEDNLNNGGDSYKAYRFNMFYDAITAKYPDILIFSSTTNYRYKSSGWDYHEYTRPDMFVSQFGMFDNWALETPIMVGEFAAVQNNTGKLEGTDWSAPRTEFPYWIGAVAEAVFLLGTERNSAKLWGVSYAPLLQNLDSYEWTPDLIAFTADPSQTLPSVSYEVLKLLGSSPFAETLPVTVGANTGFGPAFWVAGQADDRYILKAAVYNSTTDDVQFSVTFEALKGGATGQLTVLSADSPFARNTPAAREQVKKSISTVTANKDGTFEFSLPNLSVAVFEAAK